jgi:MFS family permease
VEGGAAPDPRQRRVGSGVGDAVAAASFRWYLAGIAVFSLVQTMTRFLLPWLAYELSHSSTILGLIGFALAGPTLLLAPIGGVWADRMKRLSLIRRTQAACAVLFTVFAIVFAVGAASLPVIALVAIALGALFAFDQPARQALVPSLVRPSALASAYGLIAALWNISALIGPSLAAAFLAITVPLGIGPAPIFALTAFGSCVMVLMTTRIKERTPETTRSGRRWWHEIATGLRFIESTPVAGSLVTLAYGAGLFGFSAVFLMPAIAAEIYHADVIHLGILVSAWGAGALVGLTAVIIGVWEHHRGRVALFAPAAMGIALVAFSISRNYELSVLLLGLVGALAFTYLTVAQTILQLLVPDELRGRVMGIYALSFAIAPIGATVLGMLGGVMGTAGAVGVGAVVLCGLSAVVIFRVRAIADVD